MSFKLVGDDRDGFMTRVALLFLTTINHVKLDGGNGIVRHWCCW